MGNGDLNLISTCAKLITHFTLGVKSLYFPPIPYSLFPIPYPLSPILTKFNLRSK